MSKKSYHTPRRMSSRELLTVGSLDQLKNPVDLDPDVAASGAPPQRGSALRSLLDREAVTEINDPPHCLDLSRVSDSSRRTKDHESRSSTEIPESLTLPQLEHLAVTGPPGIRGLLETYRAPKLI